MDLLPIIEIIRLEENYEHGTFGALKINKELFCFTLEPSDELNKHNISSIPCQQYICEKFNSPRFGKTYKVLNVPDREYVEFHRGNTRENTSGCILLGSSVGKLKVDKEVRAILNSGDTFDKFIAVLDPYDKFHLTYREVY